MQDLINEDLLSAIMYPTNDLLLDRLADAGINYIRSRLRQPPSAFNQWLRELGERAEKIKIVTEQELQEEQEGIPITHEF